jgi:RimJ/RimL family protein N-acetyltransferase
MPEVPTLHTARLFLRAWRDEDLSRLAELNADPRVMEFMAARLAHDESAAMLERMRAHWGRHGFGLWAVEVADSAAFAGFVGLSVPRFSARFTPCVEVGWRLAATFWGRGYATEGARAALEFGFRTRGLDAIVSFTTTTNQRSIRVMQRLGMAHDPADDFDHPLLEPGHPLLRHVLYRLARTDWDEGQKSTSRHERT